MVDAEQRGQAVEAVAGDQLGESPTSSEMAEQLRELQEQAPEVERPHQEMQQLTQRPRSSRRPHLFL